MPTTFAAQVLRRPLMLLAAWLIVLQAFLAGVATAQAGAMAAAAADPFAVICHGADGTSSQDQPDAAKVWHLCCTVCLSAAPALPAPATPSVTRTDARRAAPQVILTRFIVIAPRRAIRAGPSQGPPGPA